MLRLIIVCTVLFATACRETKSPAKADLDKIASDYVRLGLSIGEYDPDFVDAYYGPDSLKPAITKATVFPRYIFLKEVNDLQHKLSAFNSLDTSDTLYLRAKWISRQLEAFAGRINMIAGERKSFDTESKELFGVVAPHYDEAYFKKLETQLDDLLPGSGSVSERFQALANHFIIPKDKIDTVFKTAIADSRKRTLAHYALPADEHFTLEYVTGKSWSGYNWYKGNYSSNIQINTDIDIFIERAIDVAAHESYPGHHVYNMLLEENLYRKKGWVEISLYPLFSPQSLIAEGSANYGIELAFPGNEKIEFAKNVLMPVAGMDTTGAGMYFRALALRSKLNFVRNEVARGLLDKTMNDTEAMRWLIEYGFNNKETAAKSISFINKYGSYVINYNYGLELVKNYVESKGGNRWDAFAALLSNEIILDGK